MFVTPCPGTILAVVWPYSSPDNIESLGLGLHEPYLLALWIWIYCIVWWFIQDAFKVLCVKFIESHNVFGYNETGKVDMRKYSFAHTRYASSCCPPPLLAPLTRSSASRSPQLRTQPQNSAKTQLSQAPLDAFVLSHPSPLLCMVHCSCLSTFQSSPIPNFSTAS